MPKKSQINEYSVESFFLSIPNQVFGLLCLTKQHNLQLVDQIYLENYETMFNHPSKQHEPTWEAIN